MDNLQVAQTILDQMNTTFGKVKAMVSGQCLLIENGLQINFKGSRKANKVQITLNNNDLYDIKFFKFNNRTYDCPLVIEYNDVYCDMLSELWYSVTGLYLSL